MATAEPLASPTHFESKDASSLEKGGSDDVVVSDEPRGDSEAALQQKHGRLLQWMYTMGVEARGVERVPEDERSSKHAITIWTFWLSVNTVGESLLIGAELTRPVTTIPVGILGGELGLTYKQTVAIIIAFTALAAIPTAFVATLGPLTGMRTMVLSRYSFGAFGTPILIALNVLTQLGFEVIAVVRLLRPMSLNAQIVGGSLLASFGTLPLVAGCVIIAVITGALRSRGGSKLAVTITIFGYNLINYVERGAFVVMCVKSRLHTLT